ncbi:hypothetical protein PAMP_007523 [Pampus punctatissimus]
MEWLSECSAACERGFSLMNHIKTASRNRLEVAHLDQLMRMKSKQEADEAINLDKVYNRRGNCWMILRCFWASCL